MSAQHHSPGIRAHLRRFGISHDDKRRLSLAFATLEALSPQIGDAVSMCGGNPGELVRVIAALRLMVKTS